MCFCSVQAEKETFFFLFTDFNPNLPLPVVSPWGFLLLLSWVGESIPRAMARFCGKPEWIFETVLALFFFFLLKCCMCLFSNKKEDHQKQANIVFFVVVFWLLRFAPAEEGRDRCTVIAWLFAPTLNWTLFLFNALLPPGKRCRFLTAQRYMKQSLLLQSQSGFCFTSEPNFIGTELSGF